MIVLYSILGLFLAVVAFRAVRWLRTASPGNGIPQLPLLLHECEHEDLTQAHETLGDVFVTKGAPPTFFFRDVGAVGKIFSSASFGRSTSGESHEQVYSVVAGTVNVTNVVQPMMDSTFFHMDGVEWKQRRRDVNPIFASSDFRRLALDYSNQFVDHLPEDGAEVDLQDEIHTILQKAIIKLSCGVDFPEEAWPALHVCIKHFANKPDGNAPISPEDAEVLLKVLPFAKQVVKCAVAMGPSPGAERPSNVLGMLVKTGRYSEDEMARTLVNFVVAAAESPAIGIAKGAHCVASDARIRHKVHTELTEAVSTTGDGHLSTAALAHCKYLDNAMKESYRRFPPGTVVNRRCLQDTLVHGVFVPAGAQVGVCVHSVHLNPQVWDHPLEFHPERFEQHHDPFAWIPFGGGPRACPGRRAAIEMGKAVLAVLFARCNIAPTRPLTDAHAHKFTLWCPDGVPAIVTKLAEPLCAIADGQRVT